MQRERERPVATGVGYANQRRAVHITAQTDPNARHSPGFQQCSTAFVAGGSVPLVFADYSLDATTRPGWHCVDKKNFLPHLISTGIQSGTMTITWKGFAPGTNNVVVIDQSTVTFPKFKTGPKGELFAELDGTVTSGSFRGAAVVVRRVLTDCPPKPGKLDTITFDKITVTSPR
jgi:hypothetical protein